ncbi:hypothetical protein ABK040_007400 [Willaertia magna]
MVGPTIKTSGKNVTITGDNDKKDKEHDHLNYYNKVEEELNNLSKYYHTSRYISKRKVIKKYLVKNGFIKDLDFLQIVLSCCFIVIFLFDSYSNYLGDDLGSNNDFRQNIVLPVFICDFTVAVLLLLIWFITLLIQKHILLYLIHPFSILEYVTTVPIVIFCIYLFNFFSKQGVVIITLSPETIENNKEYQRVYYFAITIAICRILRVLKLLYLFIRHKGIGKLFEDELEYSLKRELFELCIVIIMFLLLFGGIVQMVEFAFAAQELTFHDAVYFLVITFATIGYGDITPKSVMTRYLIIAFFIIAVAVLPIQLSRLFRILTSEDIAFKTQNFNLNGHAILTGYTSKEPIKTFLKEFYHSKQGKNNTRMILIFKDLDLCKDLSHHVKSKNFFSNKILIYHGDILDYDTMNTIQLSKARSVFILNTNKHPNPRKYDTSIMMATIALKNYNSNLSIYAQVILPESRAYLYKAGAHVFISTETLVAKIMSKGVVSPGFCVFITNLLTTLYMKDSSHIQDSCFEKKVSTKNLLFSKCEENMTDINHEACYWLYEYLDGFSFEIYSVPFSPYFYDMLFIDAVIFIRHEFDLTLFAIENEGEVELNPGNNTSINSTMNAFVIAKSFYHANSIFLYQNVELKEVTNGIDKVAACATTAKPFFTSGIFNSLEEETSIFLHQVATKKYNLPHATVKLKHDHTVTTCNTASEMSERTSNVGQQRKSLEMNGLRRVSSANSIDNTSTTVSTINHDNTLENFNKRKEEEENPLGNIYGQDYEHFYVNEENAFQQPTEKMKRKKKRKTSKGRKLKRSESLDDLQDVLEHRPPLNENNLRNNEIELESEDKLDLRFLRRFLRSIAPPLFFRQPQWRYLTSERAQQQQIEDTTVGSQNKPKLPPKITEIFYRNVLRNYNLLRNARNINDFIINNYLSLGKKAIRNHIIITGELKHPITFISALRSIRRRHFKPIIIMIPSTSISFTEEAVKYELLQNYYVNFLYERLKFFDQIYFMKGNATDPDDFIRAGVLVSECVLFLSRRQTSSTINWKNDKSLPNTSSVSSESNEELLDSGKYITDSEAIKIILVISHIAPTKFFIIEITNTENVKYFKQIGGNFTKKYYEQSICIYKSLSAGDKSYGGEQNLEEHEQRCLLSELFASGRIFPTSLAPRLLAKSFHIKKLVDLIEYMCVDGFCSTTESAIFEDDCPSFFFNCKFIDVFTELSKEAEIILLALYRPKRQASLAKGKIHFEDNIIDNDFYYIYTNPKPLIPILKGDKLMLCGHRTKFIEFLERKKKERSSVKKSSSQPQQHKPKESEEFKRHDSIIPKEVATTELHPNVSDMVKMEQQAPLTIQEEPTPTRDDVQIEIRDEEEIPPPVVSTKSIKDDKQKQSEQHLKSVLSGELNKTKKKKYKEAPPPFRNSKESAESDFNYRQSLDSSFFRKQ